MDAVYLDYNASAPMRPQVRDAVIDAMDLPGNPSSVHQAGRAARAVVEVARARVAALVGGDKAGVVFTSGGTEANNLALRAFPGRRVITSLIEHDSVLAARPDALRVGVDSLGRVDPAAIDAMLAELEEAGEAGGGVIVSVMLANNETGVIQPLAEIARVAHARGALVHADAVQAAGRISIDMAALGLDMLSLSAHKLGGPKGVGALVLRPELAPEALVRGGGQELGRRAGTENVAGIAGFGVARRMRARRAGAAGGTGGTARWHGGAAARPCTGAGHSRPRCGEGGEHQYVGAARRCRADAGHAPGSGRHRGQRRFGLLVRQGAAIARAGRDGIWAGCRRRRDPRQPGVGNRGQRY